MTFWIIFLIGQAVYVIGSVLDYRSSLMQITHGLKEGMKLNRDKYGYFSPSRFIVIHIIFWAIFTVFAFIGYGYGEPVVLAIFGGMFILVGAVSVLFGFRNTSMARRSRMRDQVPVLEALSKIQSFDLDAINETISRFNRPVLIIGGRGRYEDFGWLYLDGLEESHHGVARVHDAVNPILWQLAARKPKNEWFANTEPRRLN